MKLFYYLLLAGLTQVQFSCTSSATKQDSEKDNAITDPASDQEFAVNPDTLTRDFMTWYNYTYYNVRLSQDFVGLDISNAIIDKSTFLNKLMAGDVVALKTKQLHGQPVYRLFDLRSKDENIKSTIRQIAAREIAHSKMEGTTMPAFDFKDLEGRTYTNASTKGKIVVLKCWFIRCGACVKEFPELNELVEAYQNKNDMVFISLAWDTKDELIKFLAQKEFKYATVPNAKTYMENNLNTTEYPTHVLIDRSGKIVKVVNNIDELVPFLKNQAGG